MHRVNEQRKKATTLRWGGIAIAALSALGVVALSPQTDLPASATESPAAGITVSWLNDSSAAAAYQPPRIDDGSGHFEEFKDLKITASKIHDLTDQVITVNVSGMPGSTRGVGSSYSNFLQFTQCWGPDPLAADFAETCQFGSWESTQDLHQKISDAGAGTGVADRGSSRFHGANGVAQSPEDGIGLDQFFNTDTTNEQPIALLNSSGTTELPFEVQTAAAAPQLGCGDPDREGGTRCWLVVIPRGTHSGNQPERQDCIPRQLAGGTFGSTTLFQSGSPLASTCTFWNNRVVIPLDFEPVRGTCPVGAAELRTSGTQMINAAIGSWQKVLCTTEGDVTLSHASNPDNTARRALLQGLSDLAFTGGAATEAEVQQFGDPGQELSYAPVANGALTIAFVHNMREGYTSDLKLSARLVAKLLTQSYVFQIPQISGRGGDTSHLGEVNRTYQRIQDDPEFALLNPGVTQISPYPEMPAIVVSGPAGEDVIAQLWAWIQADDDARGFLQGKPDEAGMSINPYYLPSGNALALGDGLSFDLASDRVDTFLKADQTLAPDKVTADLNYKGSQVDSLAMSPYRNSFDDVVKDVFRANSKALISWNAQTPNAVGELGAWVGSPQLIGAGGQYILGVADLAGALDFGLSTAALQVPNTDSYVSPSSESMTAAVAALRTDERGTGQIDMSKLSADAYPLTYTTYAAAIPTSESLTVEEREDYATVLRYIAGDGQTVGTLPGQLPEGYVPLTDDQRARVLVMIDQLLNPPIGETPSLLNNQIPDAPNLPAPDISVQEDVAPAGEITASAAAPAQAALGVSLLAGLGGVVAAPFMLRRRKLNS